MAKPTPRSAQSEASLMLRRAKYAPRRTCPNSAGVACSLGKPYEWSRFLSGLGPGGPVRAPENASRGAPAKTK
eukprot:9807491-Alexandrium_andersonii.AAC.1